MFTDVFLTKFDYSNGKLVSTNWSSLVPYKTEPVSLECHCCH